MHWRLQMRGTAANHADDVRCDTAARPAQTHARSTPQHLHSR